MTITVSEREALERIEMVLREMRLGGFNNQQRANEIDAALKSLLAERATVEPEQQEDKPEPSVVDEIVKALEQADRADAAINAQMEGIPEYATAKDVALFECRIAIKMMRISLAECAPAERAAGEERIMDSDTPRTDEKAWRFRRQTVGQVESPIEWAKQLGRELAASQRLREDLLTRYVKSNARVEELQQTLTETDKLFTKRQRELEQRVEELEKALRIIEFQGGNVMERWSAGIARAALSRGLL